MDGGDECNEGATADGARRDLTLRDLAESRQRRRRSRALHCSEVSGKSFLEPVDGEHRQRAGANVNANNFDRCCVSKRMQRRRHASPGCCVSSRAACCVLSLAQLADGRNWRTTRPPPQSAAAEACAHREALPTASALRAFSSVRPCRHRSACSTPAGSPRRLEPAKLYVELYAMHLVACSATPGLARACGSQPPCSPAACQPGRRPRCATRRAGSSQADDQVLRSVSAAAAHSCSCAGRDSARRSRRHAWPCSKHARAQRVRVPKPPLLEQQGSGPTAHAKAFSTVATASRSDLECRWVQARMEAVRCSAGARGPPLQMHTHTLNLREHSERESHHTPSLAAQPLGGSCGRDVPRWRRGV
jgi:hypothetical protein